MQQISGQLWGKAPRWGSDPVVQAIDGALSEGARGLEFWTDVEPVSWRNTFPGYVNWRLGTPGVIPFEGADGADWARIDIVVTKNTQVDGPTDGPEGCE